MNNDIFDGFSIKQKSAVIKDIDFKVPKLRYRMNLLIEIDIETQEAVILSQAVYPAKNDDWMIKRITKPKKEQETLIKNEIEEEVTEEKIGF